MRIPKFIIPVFISVAAFIWGYRGELWLGVNPRRDKEPKGSNQGSDINSTSNGPKSSVNLKSPPTQGNILSNSVKVQAAPISNNDTNEEYEPEEDPQEEENVEDGGEAEDLESDQALPEDEPGTETEENEEAPEEAGAEPGVSE